MADKKPGRAREQVRTLCRRWTAPREQIFKLLMRKRRQHLSAKEIFALLEPAGHDIGIATIYRTLDLLDKAGLLRKIQCRGNQVRYQYRRSDRPDCECHLICTACSKILDCRDYAKKARQLTGKSEVILEKKSGFLIRDHIIEYYGLCRKCRLGRAKIKTKLP
jgi:Fur family ferric uptake transcriptional regulator